MLGLGLDHILQEVANVMLSFTIRKYLNFLDKSIPTCVSSLLESDECFLFLLSKALREPPGNTPF